MKRAAGLLLGAVALAVVAGALASLALFALAIGLLLVTLAAGVSVALAARRLVVTRSVLHREVGEDQPISVRFQVRGRAGSRCRSTSRPRPTPTGGCRWARGRPAAAADRAPRPLAAGTLAAAPARRLGDRPLAAGGWPARAAADPAHARPARAHPPTTGREGRRS